jgi:hypothetical protein
MNFLFFFESIRKKSMLGAKGLLQAELLFSDGPVAHHLDH